MEQSIGFPDCLWDLRNGLRAHRTVDWNIGAWTGLGKLGC